jgi:hypothetical protein
MSEPQNLAATAAALTARLPRHTFTLPEEKRDPKTGELLMEGVRELETDPKTVTLRQLTCEEEQQALQAAKARGVDFSYDGAMRAVVAADGKAITWDNDGKEQFFRSLSAKARDLVVIAFQHISLPKREAVSAFLASEKVENP